MKLFSKFVCLAVAIAMLPTPSFADLRSDVGKVRKQLQQRKFAAAEKLFKQLQDENQGTPAALQLKSLHANFAASYIRARQHLKGGQHTTSYIDFLMPRLERSPAMANSLPRFINQMAGAFSAAKKPELAEEKLEQYLKATLAASEKNKAPQLNSLIASIQSIKVLFLARQKRSKQANDLLSKLIASQEKKLGDKPKDVGAVSGMIVLQGARVQLAKMAKSKDVAKFQKDLLKLASKSVKANPDSGLLILQFVNLNLSSISQQVYKDAKVARGLLNDFEATLDDLTSTDQRGQRILNSVRKSNIPRLRRSIVSVIQRDKLIGQSSAPLEVEAWANGKELTDKDLKGKVILLDFWAVWCGPCIATFPHLREWREKYGKEGLEIIGVTRYYKYGWNDKAKRPVRDGKISREDERKAMEAFAKHHKLKHPFAVATDGGYASKYKVSGIPQAVLIDRKGKIRLIRVGSGPANAKALHAMIQKLLAEK